MKEVTMVITCELTDIMRIPDRAALPPADCVPPYAELAKLLKQDLQVDDVTVSNVKFFVRDIPNSSEVGVETPNTAVQGA